MLFINLALPCVAESSDPGENLPNSRRVISVEHYHVDLLNYGHETLESRSYKNVANDAVLLRKEKHITDEAQYEWYEYDLIYIYSSGTVLNEEETE